MRLWSVLAYVFLILTIGHHITHRAIDVSFLLANGSPRPNVLPAARYTINKLVYLQNGTRRHGNYTLNRRHLGVENAPEFLIV